MTREQALEKVQAKLIELENSTDDQGVPLFTVMDSGSSIAILFNDPRYEPIEAEYNA